MAKRMAYASPQRTLRGTPFADAALMETLEIEFTEDVKAADFIFAQSLKSIKEEDVSPGRHVVIWTAEPKWDQSSVPFVPDYLGGGDAHIFNVYNWNVYTDNFRMGPIEPRPRPEKTKTSFDRSLLDDFRIAVFAAFRDSPVHIRGRDVALDRYRGQLALDLHRLGRCDIQGDRWPPGIALGSTRSGNWGQIKWEALKAYAFNLCCENTDFDYYVSEKFWDSIRGGALPIYYPNRLFCLSLPKDSFIDLRQPNLQTAEQVMDFLGALTVDEYIERFNRCLSVYNRCGPERWRFDSAARSSELVAALLSGL